ncbi:MAG: M13 family metallopeptidase N-terminal domain-containing protein, partial [Pseudohongiellaceae bacterium]
MKSISLLFTLLITTLLAACNQEATPPQDQASMSAPPAAMEAGKPELGDWGVNLNNRDLAINPGDDFFRFANGTWLNEFEIPADRSRFGAFDILSKQSSERVNTIIQDLVNSEPAIDSMEQKIADYYQSYMDVETLNSLGVEPLRDALAAINEIDSVAELVQAFGRSQLDTTASPFGFGISPDRVDPDWHQLSISVGGISLPDRDYYLLDEQRFVDIRNAYHSHIIRMLDFSGMEDTDLMADAIVELETRIAETMWPRDQRRNRDLTYNPMSYADFKAAYPGFNWDAFFAAAGVEGLEDLNVSFPSAMSPLIDIINSTSLDDWQAFLAYKLISNNAGILSEDIDNENFQFYGTVLNGIPQQRERWERGVMSVGSLNSLGEALGQIYVQRHFPESA